jgi:hypothetical protein
MNHLVKLVWLGSLAAALIVAGLLGGPTPARAQCPEPKDTTPRDPSTIGGEQVPGMDLVCFPSKLHANEGKWTFFLRGPDVLDVTGGYLIAGRRRHSHTRLNFPTPRSALIDFTYPALQVGDTAELVLEQDGRERGRLSIAVTRGDRVRPERRQRALVRLQLQPWTLLYPLHGFSGDRGTTERKLAEIAGAEEFLAVLQDLGIERLRKVMSRYAEDDSVHWDPRFLREVIYNGEHLRQYLVYFDPDRSEAAFKEIFLCFSEVEKAFINEDKSRKRTKS